MENINQLIASIENHELEFELKILELVSNYNLQECESLMITNTLRLTMHDDYTKLDQPSKWLELQWILINLIKSLKQSQKKAM